MLNIAIGHGMVARKAGRYRVGAARPINGVVARTGVWLGWRWLGWRLGRWLEHRGWMPTRLHETGRKLRSLPMGKVRQAANLLGDAADCGPRLMTRAA